MFKKTVIVMAVLFSAGVQAQTSSEYVDAIGKNLKTSATENLVCWNLEAVIEVHNQDVKLIKKSGNNQFDYDVLTVAKKSLDKGFNSWVQFPVSTSSVRSCAEIGERSVYQEILVQPSISADAL